MLVLGIPGSFVLAGAPACKRDERPFSDPFAILHGEISGYSSFVLCFAVVHKAPGCMICWGGGGIFSRYSLFIFSSCVFLRAFLRPFIPLRADKRRKKRTTNSNLHFVPISFFFPFSSYYYYFFNIYYRILFYFIFYFLNRTMEGKWQTRQEESACGGRGSLAEARKEDLSLFGYFPAMRSWPD